MQVSQAAPAGFQLRITFCDTEMNGVVTLGGAECESMVAWNRAWQGIPASPLGMKEPAWYSLDKIDQAGDRVDEKLIAPETVEALLGRPLPALIAEGRARTIFTWGQYKAITRAAPMPTLALN